MDVESALAGLERLLQEEREAIVRFDGASLERFTDQKLALLEVLRTGARPAAEQVRRYQGLLQEVRLNLALLSHGRACLRDVITALGGGSSDPLVAPRTGLHVRVTG